MLKKLNPSLLVVFGLFVLVLFLRFYGQSWGRDGVEILQWDVMGYYLYLPSWFIYGDIAHLEFIPEIFNTYEPSATFYQAHLIENGNQVMKYSMGMSVLYAPGFFLAHLLAEPLGYPADGFSAPYQVGVALNGIVFMLIGMLYLRKVLLHFFSQKVTIIVLMLLVIGTNYLQFTMVKESMPHNYIFTLFAALLWYTIQWHKNPKLKYAIAIGATIGLATLARPSELIVILVPLLWSSGNIAQFKAKWKQVAQYWPHMLALGFTIFLVLLPQFLYWYSVSDSFIHYTYGSEGFVWNRPQFLNVLFSYKKGWLLYTPLMGFSILGLLLAIKHKREIFWSVGIFFLINLFLISAWSNWWFASSFGHRAFIQSYALLALPLGFFLHWIFERKVAWQVLTGIPVVAFVVLNLFQHWQYQHYILHPFLMTKAYYWDAFGATSTEEADVNLLAIEEFHNPYDEYIKDEYNYNRSFFYKFDFETPDQNEIIKGFYTNKRAFKGNGSIKLDPENKHAVQIKKNILDITPVNKSWIRASLRYYSSKKSPTNKSQLILDFKSVGKSFKYKAIPFDSIPSTPGQWNQVYLECIIPEVRYEDDLLEAYVWHKEEDTLWIDDFQLELFEPINENDSPEVIRTWTENMEDLKSNYAPFIDSTLAAQETKSIRLSAALSYSPGFSLTETELGARRGDVLEGSVAIYPLAEATPDSTALVFAYEKDGKLVHYTGRPLPLRAKAKQWSAIQLREPLPEDLPSGYRFKVYVFHKGKQPVLVDALELKLTDANKE